MKLKYYMRGIGIGMIVTALLFMIGASATNKMSDEEILARAKELGLVEKTVLREPAAASSEEEKKEASSQEEEQTLSEEEPVVTSEENTEDLSQEPSEEMSDNASDSTSEEETEEAIEEFVIIEIVSGDSSVSVSQKVYEAGLVASASEFDRFLCANGYDRRLRVGQHEVRLDSSMQEIAEALSN